MDHAGGEILFFTDVRQTLAADSLRNLIANFADPKVGVVSGELVILDKAGHEDAQVGLYWKYEKWLRKRLSRIDSLPGATGCIYAMRRELAGPLPPDCLLDDVYLPMIAFFRGRRLVLDETAKAYDTAISRETEFWRKVRTQAGVYQLLGWFPQLLELAEPHVDSFCIPQAGASDAAVRAAGDRGDQFLASDSLGHASASRSGSILRCGSGGPVAAAKVTPSELAGADLRNSDGGRAMRNLHPVPSGQHVLDVADRGDQTACVV